MRCEVVPVSLGTEFAGWWPGLRRPGPVQLGPAAAAFPVSQSEPHHTFVPIPSSQKVHSSIFHSLCTQLSENVYTLKHIYVLFYLSNNSVTCTLSRVSIIERQIPSLAQSHQKLYCPSSGLKCKLDLKPFICPRNSFLHFTKHTNQKKPQDITFDVWYLFHICSNKYESIGINW